MNTIKKALFSLLAIASAGSSFAQLPEIKGAEAQLRQSASDKDEIIGAKRSIDNAGAITGAEGMAYYWYVRAAVYAEYSNRNGEKYDQVGLEIAAVEAVKSLTKFYELAKDDKKATKKYEYLADQVIEIASVNAYNKAINHTLDSNYDQALVVYGALANLIKYDEAHREILKTKQPTITYNQILKNSYITSFQKGDNPLTRKYLTALIDNKYTDPKLHVYIARTYENEGNKVKQLDAIKKGRMAYPQSKDIITEEINYYIKNNDLITLKNAIDKEIAGGNADANYYYIRGYVYDQIGNGAIDDNGKNIVGEKEKDTAMMRKAEMDYIKSIELDPNNLNSIYNLGTLYTNFGNYWNKKATNLPYSATELYAKYRTFENGYFEKAIQYYERADGFSDLTDEERINMYRDMMQLYAKQKNLAKRKEMSAKIRALNGNNEE